MFTEKTLNARKKYEEHLEEAYNLYQTGEYSIASIAREFGLERKLLSKMLKEKYPDLVIRADGKKIVDSYAFDNIDTEEKAYWLGFLYADGYVSDGYLNSRLELCLQIQDKNHIEKFKKFMKSTHKITEKTIPNREAGKEYRAARITIQDKHLNEALQKWGCVNKKSTIIIFPHFEDSLMRHFIRGFFDGDGCICLGHKKDGNDRYRAAFTSGSKSFLEELSKYLLQKGFPSKISKDSRSKAMDLTISQSFTERFLTYLYKNSCIYLDRKYDLYLAVLGQDATSRPRIIMEELSGEIAKTLKEIELDNPSPKADN